LNDRCKRKLCAITRRELKVKNHLKNSKTSMDRPFGAAVFDCGSLQPKPSLYAKVLKFRAFCALQITTRRGRLQQITQSIMSPANT